MTKVKPNISDLLISAVLIFLCVKGIRFTDVHYKLDSQVVYVSLNRTMPYFEIEANICNLSKILSNSETNF